MARIGDQHGKIHEVACGRERGEFPLEAMPFFAWYVGRYTREWHFVQEMDEVAICQKRHR